MSAGRSPSTAACSARSYRSNRLPYAGRRTSRSANSSGRPMRPRQHGTAGGLGIQPSRHAKPLPEHPLTGGGEGHHPRALCAPRPTEIQAAAQYRRAGGTGEMVAAHAPIQARPAQRAPLPRERAGVDPKLHEEAVAARRQRETFAAAVQKTSLLVCQRSTRPTRRQDGRSKRGPCAAPARAGSRAPVARRCDTRHPSGFREDQRHRDRPDESSDACLAPRPPAVVPRAAWRGAC